MENSWKLSLPRRTAESGLADNWRAWLFIFLPGCTKGYNSDGNTASIETAFASKKNTVPRPLLTEWELEGARIESIVKGVDRDINEDIQSDELEIKLAPSAEAVQKAKEIALLAAEKFSRREAVDIAAFVNSDGAVAILTHSMKTGRRATFYVTGSEIRAIRTAPHEKPKWTVANSVTELDSLLAWVHP